MRCALALLLPFLAIGQVRTFDAATVKPAGQGPIGLKRVSGGRITVANYTLRGLIHEAWRLDDYQISGRRGWLNTACFDIAAVVPRQPTARAGHHAAGAP